MTGVMRPVRTRAYARDMDEKILHPRFPERVCWGCDKFCPADDLACGGGTIRTPHPVEIFGDDWTPNDLPPVKPAAPAEPDDPRD